MNHKSKFGVGGTFKSGAFECLRKRSFRMVVALFVVLLALPALALAAPDVTVTGISYNTSNVKLNQPVTVTATIKNVGDATATDAWLNFGITRGTSTILTQNLTGYALAPNEVQSVTLSWTPFATGTHTVTATAGSPVDTNKANDVLASNVNVVSFGGRYN